MHRPSRVSFLTIYSRPHSAKPTITHEMHQGLKDPNDKREAPGDVETSHEHSDAEVESLVSLQEHVRNPKKFMGRQIQTVYAKID
jgi:hypothetical protein